MTRHPASMTPVLQSRVLRHITSLKQPYQTQVQQLAFVTSHYAVTATDVLRMLTFHGCAGDLHRMEKVWLQHGCSQLQLPELWRMRVRMYIRNGQLEDATRIALEAQERGVAYQHQDIAQGIHTLEPEECINTMARAGHVEKATALMESVANGSIHVAHKWRVLRHAVHAIVQALLRQSKVKEAIQMAAIKMHYGTHEQVYPRATTFVWERIFRHLARTKHTIHTLYPLLEAVQKTATSEQAVYINATIHSIMFNKSLNSRAWWYRALFTSWKALDQAVQTQPMARKRLKVRMRRRLKQWKILERPERWKVSDMSASEQQRLGL